MAINKDRFGTIVRTSSGSLCLVYEKSIMEPFTMPDGTEAFRKGGTAIATAELKALPANTNGKLTGVVGSILSNAGTTADRCQYVSADLADGEHGAVGYLEHVRKASAQPTLPAVNGADTKAPVKGKAHASA